MIGIWLGAALGAPLLVRVSDAEQQLRDPVEGRVEGGGEARTFTPLDDGQPPDVLAGDGVRSVVVQAPDAPTLTITLTDARGRAWTVTAEVPEGAQRDLDLRVGPEGRLEPYTPLGPSAGAAPSGGGAPRGPPELDGAGARTLGWALAVAGWALAAGLLWRRARPLVLRARPGVRPAPLPPSWPRDRQGALPEALAGRRVLWLGPPPPFTLGEGQLFLAPEGPLDLQAAVAALEGKGPPLALVLAAPARDLAGPLRADALRAALPGVEVLELVS